MFEAPLHRVPAPVDVAAAEAVPAAAARLHVLIVDDNPTNRLVAPTLCEMFGCTSEAVEDGLGAIKAASTGRFDLVLMDVKMPGMDEVEATRRIWAGVGPGSQAPIIALTANADPGDAAFYRASGMNGVVEKPIKPDRLLAAMNAVLHLPDAEAVGLAWALADCLAKGVAFPQRPWLTSARRKIETKVSRGGSPTASLTQNVAVKTDSSLIVNGALTLTDISMGGGGATASLSLWSRNLLDESHIYRISAANRGTIGDYADFNLPRTFGVELD